MGLTDLTGCCSESPNCNFLQSTGHGHATCRTILPPPPPTVQVHHRFSTGLETHRHAPPKQNCLVTPRCTAQDATRMLQGSPVSPGLRQPCRAAAWTMSATTPPCRSLRSSPQMRVTAPTVEISPGRSAWPKRGLRQSERDCTPMTSARTAPCYISHKDGGMVRKGRRATAGKPATVALHMYGVEPTATGIREDFKAQPNEKNESIAIVLFRRGFTTQTIPLLLHAYFPQVNDMIWKNKSRSSLMYLLARHAVAIRGSSAKASSRTS